MPLRTLEWGPYAWSADGGYLQCSRPFHVLELQCDSMSVRATTAFLCLMGHVYCRSTGTCATDMFLSTGLGVIGTRFPGVLQCSCAFSGVLQWSRGFIGVLQCSHGFIGKLQRSRGFIGVLTWSRGSIGHVVAWFIAVPHGFGALLVWVWCAGFTFQRQADRHVLHGASADRTYLYCSNSGICRTIMLSNPATYCSHSNSYAVAYIMSKTVYVLILGCRILVQVVQP